MSVLADPVIELVRSHSVWIAPVVFALAFCESFAFVSLLVPATIILFAVGGIIGLSGIEYWSIWTAAAIGAAAGDWLAYGLAVRFKYRIVHVWPLSGHPEVVSRGFAFFKRWGIVAVFVGRFLGPLRAIVPIAAGVCGMSWLRFQIANATSAIVWATGILAPGTFGLRWWNGG
jgi:membrane protein DedA with SNARE-associated domain